MSSKKVDENLISGREILLRNIGSFYPRVRTINDAEFLAPSANPKRQKKAKKRIHFVLIF
jgi:hypothetical protein